MLGPFAVGCRGMGLGRKRSAYAARPRAPRSIILETQYATTMEAVAGGRWAASIERGIVPLFVKLADDPSCRDDHDGQGD
jgi:hypothetical protein